MLSWSTVLRRAIACCAVLVALTLMARAPVGAAETTYPVGLKRVEYVDGDRHLALSVFYPAAIHDGSPAPFAMPFFVNLHLYKDADIAADGHKRPLIMLSHGRGSNGLYYAWFAEVLAAHGYIVAALDHYRANSYDSTIEYLANKLWQRPLDIGLSISFLLRDPTWDKVIDDSRIGVAGHSQGGFTALWIGGAMVNRDKYLAFQRRWRDNQMVPEYLRKGLSLDPEPALKVRDPRVKAVFAMAPGIIQAFGMDESGLGQLTIPAYIMVGARDTQTPPKDNAEFAAKYIPHAQLNVIPGNVDHEIFVNECNEEGKDEFPEACIDAPGVDRAKVHDEIGAAALKFFADAL